jgi:hypothetical protein
MKTNYQNINSFEVAIVGMITAGFILVGIILFSTLTPRTQANVASSLNMFDIHERVADTISSTTDEIGFMMDIPNQFYNQFYIAFTQTATLPSETFEIPAQIATELSRDVSAAINNLGVQVAEGYSHQIQTEVQSSQATQEGTELAYESYPGKVLGATVDLISAGATAGSVRIVGIGTGQNINFPYTYSPPELSQVKYALLKLIKQ